MNAIKKTLNNGSGNNQLGTERPCGQIIRIIEKSSIVDFHCLWLLDGLGTLASIIENGIQPNSDVSRVAVIKAIQLYRNASSSCKQIAQHSILGGSFITLLDVLIYTLKVICFMQRFIDSFHLCLNFSFFENQIYRILKLKLKRHPCVQSKYLRKYF